MALHPVFFKSILMALLMTLGFRVAAQNTPTNNNLFQEISRMDSALFTAFNNRDVATFQNLFDNDLEFYHDKGGLTNYNHTVAFLKTNAANNSDLRRTLVPGSTEVYPIPGYGAMQMGSHTFCHTEAGKPDCGTFKFMNIWKKTEAGWKITRVVSYDHK